MFQKLLCAEVALILAANAAFRLCVVLSVSSSPHLHDTFAQRLSPQVLSGNIDLQVIDVGLNLQVPDELVKECALIFDAAGNSYIRANLNEVSRDSHIALLTPETTSMEYEKIHSSSTGISNSLMSVIHHFAWKSISLIYSPGEIAAENRDELSAYFQCTQTLISENESEESIKKLLRKEVKRQGSNIIVLATSAAVTAAVLQELQSQGLMREGYAYIATGGAVWSSEQWPGLLQLRELDCIRSSSISQCSADRVAGILVRAAEALGVAIGDLSADDLWNCFSGQDNLIKSEVVLVNTRAGWVEIVGRFDGEEMTQVETVYFIGNVTSLPEISQGKVEISFNSGLENPTTPPTPEAGVFYRGNRYAVEVINARNDILPKHTLVSNDVAFGAAEWSESWAVPRILESKDRLGVAHMAGYVSMVAINSMRTFARFGISRPVVGSSTSFIALGNATEYPWFVRTGVTDLFLAGLYLNVIPVLGWKRCAVLYGDDPWGTTIYSNFLEMANAHKIEILNKEEFRRVPSLASKEVYWTEYREHLLELFRCNARFVVMFLLEPIPQYILELLFDLGARKGDFIFACDTISTSYITNAAPASSMKHAELMEGMVGFMVATWIGQEGETARLGFSQQYGDADPSPYVCYYYDSVMAAAHAIDTCVQLDVDYENPVKLMKFLRETRFLGCSGFVSWQHGDNNRAYLNYNILNLVRNVTTGEYFYATVGRYSPTSVLLFNFTSPIIFGDGSSNTPSDLRVVLMNCPFEAKWLKDFKKGRHLAAGVCAIVVITTVAFLLLIYKKVWQIDTPDMVKAEISVEDVVFMGTIGIEAVQLSSMGPDFRSLNSLLMKLSQLVAVDLSDVISFRNGVFWIALDVVFAIVVVWTAFNVFAFFHLEEKLQKFYLARFIGFIAYLTLPLLGNVCFVPIVFVLLDVFVCDQAVGGQSLSYHDSILSRDCYATCWRDTHSLYAAAASVSLLVYIPTAILLRPVWQDYQDSLHIRTYPLFIVTKSLVQVVLICLSKTLKRWDQTASGIVFLCVIAAFFSVACRFRAYNYRRANLWQCLSLAGVFVLNLIALINDTVYSNSNFSLVILVAITWAGLIGKYHVVFGLIYQHRYLPSMLYKKPGRDFSKLIKFAFTNSVLASEVKPELAFAARKDASSASVIDDLSQTARQ